MIQKLREETKNLRCQEQARSRELENVEADSAVLSKRALEAESQAKQAAHTITMLEADLSKMNQALSQVDNLRAENERLSVLADDSNNMIQRPITTTVRPSVPLATDPEAEHRSDVACVEAHGSTTTNESQSGQEKTAEISLIQTQSGLTEEDSSHAGRGVRHPRHENNSSRLAIDGDGSDAPHTLTGKSAAASQSSHDQKIPHEAQQLSEVNRQASSGQLMRWMASSNGEIEMKEDKINDPQSSLYNGKALEPAYKMQGKSDHACPPSGDHERDLSATQERARSEFSHSPDKPNVESPEVVPESPPTRNNRALPGLAAEPNKPSAGLFISSSPLSDIGDLFSAHEREDPSSAHRNEGVDLGQSCMLRRDAAPPQIPSLHERIEESDYTTSRQPLQLSMQEAKPPSSSYGEPLLLDDMDKDTPLIFDEVRTESVVISNIEGGVHNTLWSGNGLSHVVRDNLETGLRGSTNLETSNANDTTQCYRPIKTAPSTRRLCRVTTPHGSASQLSNDPIDDPSQVEGDATPLTRTKEKHQPNSAVKRKSESHSAANQTELAAEKRIKRNLSNVEMRDRSERRFNILETSWARGGASNSERPARSSKSRKSDRATVVGKNAPAPRSNRQGSRKARGGSRSNSFRCA